MTSLRSTALAGATAWLCACGPADGHPVICPGEGDYEYADVIVDAPGHATTPASVDVPQNAINGVVEGKLTSQSLDVYSRGLSTSPPNHYMVLRFSGRRVVDVAGPDFVVFENAFEVAGGGTFMEHAVVEVSDDGENWVAFPHDYVAPDEDRYSSDPADWRGFAGTTPVAWQSRGCTSPFGEGVGGDAFDLADLPDPSLAQGFTYLRLTAAPTMINPDTGNPYPRDVASDGFDIDGVFARATRDESR